MRLLPLLLGLAAALPAAAQDMPPKNPGKEPLAVPPAATDSPALPAAPADPALDAVMDRIETRVAMPGGAAAVADHARFYAWADPQRTKVTAVYLAGTPGRHWVSFDDLPDITMLRSGCGAIALVYDVRSNQLDEIGCGP